MALVYQNGITVNTATGQIVAVGNATGSGGGNYQNTGSVSTPAPAPTAPAPSSGGGGGGGSATPTPTPTGTWTNIITGQVVTGALPAGGSNAGWVAGTTAPSPGTTTPTPYPGAVNPSTGTANPLPPTPTVPAGYTTDPSGALMPVNPTPTTATPFQTNALTQAGLATSALTNSPALQAPAVTAVEALTTAQELAKGTKEGDIRKNAETGKTETFTPAGVWEEVGTQSKINEVTAVPAQTKIPVTNKPSTNQLLNVDMIKLYSPNEYQRLADGRVVLNIGVTPKPGTTKVTAIPVEPTVVEEKPVEEKPITEPLTAEDVLTALGLDSKTEAEYIADVMDSPEFDWFMKKYGLKNTNVAAQAEAAKEMLDTKYAVEKSKLENNLAAKGLAFSGIRASQVAGLAANLAASKLEVDRKMAMQVLDLDTTLMDTMLKLVADKVKEATEGRKEALGMLEDMGLTINPLTGKLVPTLQAQTAAMTQARADAYLNLAYAKENRMILESQTKDVSFFTDASGLVRAVDKATGKVIWQARYGRAGSASPTINVSPVIDPISGTAKYVQVVNKSTGKVEYKDINTGVVVDPAKVQINEPMNAIDVYVNDIMNEMFNEAGSTPALAE